MLRDAPLPVRCQPFSHRSLDPRGTPPPSPTTLCPTTLANVLTLCPLRSLELGRVPVVPSRPPSPLAEYSSRCCKRPAALSTHGLLLCRCLPSLLCGCPLIGVADKRLSQLAYTSARASSGTTYAPRWQQHLGNGRRSAQLRCSHRRSSTCHFRLSAVLIRFSVCS